MSVSPSALNGMKLNNVRMTAAEAAASTGPGTWVEQPGCGSPTAPRGTRSSPTGWTSRGRTSATSTLPWATCRASELAGVELSGRTAATRDGSPAKPGHNWVQSTAASARHLHTGAGTTVTSDLRSAALSDMSLSGTDLSAVTLDDTRIFNITDRAVAWLPAGEYTWVDQGGGKELLTGPGSPCRGRTWTAPTSAARPTA